MLHAWIQGEIVQQYSQDSVFQEFFIRPPLVNPDTFLLNEHGETYWPSRTYAWQSPFYPIWSVGETIQMATNRTQLTE